MKVFTSIIIIFLLSCSSQDRQLTAEEKSEINVFVSNLTASIQNLEYDFLRSSFNHEAFKQRVSEYIDADLTAFKYIYDEKIKIEVDIANNELINKQKYSNGEIKHLSTEFRRSHAEVSYLLFFDKSFSLLKYRIEKYGPKLILSDYFMFTQNVWASEYMSHIALVNKRHLAGSENRIKANKNFRLYRESIALGDSSTALYYLNKIPETHQVGNYLSLLKIRCAAGVSDTVFVEVLITEQETQKSLYLDYLTSYYLSDSLEFEKVCGMLSKTYAIPEKELKQIRNAELMWQ